MKGIIMYSGFNFTPTRMSDPGARMEAGAASRKARDAGTAVQFMKGEIERLLMITEALWTILKEENGFSDNKLIEYIARIDLKDGKLDGRVTEKKGPVKCKKCNRSVSKTRPVCIYCGAIIIQEPFAR